MLLMMAIVLIFPLLKMILPGNEFIKTVSGKVDVGLVAMCFTVIALLLKLAPQKGSHSKGSVEYDYHDRWSWYAR